MQKHGVPFARACEVFFDPFVQIVDASAPAESREAAIGYADGEPLLLVVHVIRHEEFIRLISAREATREERRQYENP
ncbi:MAG: BrnT family toxin [Pseudomonadota bacterium]